MGCVFIRIHFLSHNHRYILQQFVLLMPVHVQMYAIYSSSSKMQKLRVPDYNPYLLTSQKLFPWI